MRADGPGSLRDAGAGAGRSNASGSAGGDTIAWIRSRAPIWNSWLAQPRVRTAALGVAEAQHFIERYRTLAHDLATARRLMPGSRTTAALESLYLYTHAEIERAPRAGGAALLRLFRDQIPAQLHALRIRIFATAVLLLASAAAGWWLIRTYPELISLVASQSMIQSVEHGHLWTHELFNIVPSSVVSLRILSNNIVVSLLAFCSGVFFGLGVFYLVALNGLMLGALFAFTHQYGLDGQLLNFVLPHGPVELSVICIAAAAGLALGEALLRPTLPSRRDSFERAAHRSGPVLLACALLLVGCGLIEGYVSPDPQVPLVGRVAIGSGYWALMWALLSGRLLRWLTPVASLSINRRGVVGAAPDTSRAPRDPVSEGAPPARLPPARAAPAGYVRVRR